VPARPRSLTGEPRLLALARTPLLSLSPSHCSVRLACRRRFFSHALSLSLPRAPHPSVVPNVSPRSPPWTHPRLRVLRPPPHALAPLEPAPRLPTSPCSLAPSAELFRPLSHPARATRQLCRRSPKPVVVPRSSLSPRRVRCPGEFCLTVSNSGHPLVRLLPLWFARSMHSESAAIDPRLHRLPAVLQALLGSHSW
jgi:hypothetical protein